MIQVVGRYPVLPIPSIHAHLANLVAAYAELVAASLTISLNQPILTMPG